jgi:hypothetical protein
MDFVIGNHGSIVTFHAITCEARDWLDENVASEGWQYLGARLCVDHRYAATLTAAIVAAGLEIGDE